MIQVEDLVRRWDKEQCRALPPARAAEVVAAFDSVGCMATADVVELYGRCGGMEQMDDNYWRLWSLAEITRKNAEKAEFGALFGDYLIDSWCYRLKPVNPQLSAVYMDYYNGSRPFLVAASLGQFLESLWLDPRGILEGQGLGSAT